MKKHVAIIVACDDEQLREKIHRNIIQRTREMEYGEHKDEDVYVSHVMAGLTPGSLLSAMREYRADVIIDAAGNITRGTEEFTSWTKAFSKEPGADSLLAANVNVAPSVLTVREVLEYYNNNHPEKVTVRGELTDLVIPDNVGCMAENILRSMKEPGSPE